MQCALAHGTGWFFTGRISASLPTMIGSAERTISWPQRVLYGLTNWGLLIAGLVNLGVGTLSALRGNVGIAATSLTAGLVLLFAATIDRFELLKGLGIEARTRKLDERIERADEALRRLRELAELTTDT